MVDAVTNDDQLSAVIGQEMAHCLLRHFNNALSWHTVVRCHFYYDTFQSSVVFVHTVLVDLLGQRNAEDSEISRV